MNEDGGNTTEGREVLYNRSAEPDWFSLNIKSSKSAYATVIVKTIIIFGITSSVLSYAYNMEPATPYDPQPFPGINANISLSCSPEKFGAACPSEYVPTFTCPEEAHFSEYGWKVVFIGLMGISFFIAVIISVGIHDWNLLSGHVCAICCAKSTLFMIYFTYMQVALALLFLISMSDDRHPERVILTLDNCDECSCVYEIDRMSLVVLTVLVFIGFVKVYFLRKQFLRLIKFPYLLTGSPIPAHIAVRLNPTDITSIDSNWSSQTEWHISSEWLASEIEKSRKVAVCSAFDIAYTMSDNQREEVFQNNFELRYSFDNCYLIRYVKLGLLFTTVDIAIYVIIYLSIFCIWGEVPAFIGSVYVFVISFSTLSCFGILMPIFWKCHMRPDQIPYKVGCKRLLEEEDSLVQYDIEGCVKMHVLPCVQFFLLSRWILRGCCKMEIAIPDFIYDDFIFLPASFAQDSSESEELLVGHDIN